MANSSLIYIFLKAVRLRAARTIRTVLSHLLPGTGIFDFLQGVVGGLRRYVRFNASALQKQAGGNPPSPVVCLHLDGFEVDVPMFRMGSRAAPGTVERIGFRS